MHMHYIIGKYNGHKERGRKDNQTTLSKCICCSHLFIRFQGNHFFVLKKVFSECMRFFSSKDEFGIDILGVVICIFTLYSSILQDRF